jgi:putative endonuclease
MAVHNQLGAKGETLAKAFLEEKGYEIIDENWSHGKAEVDLIAYFEKQIIFIEVKTRSSTTFGQPEEFVNEAKQKNLKRAAEEYIYLMRFKGEIRFDIIAIVFTKQGQYQVRHVEDAFW